MKESQNAATILSSGFQKIYLGLGLSLAILSIYVVVFKDNELRDTTVILAISFGLLFLGRPKKMKLTKTEFIVRSLGVLKTTYSLDDLTWVYLTDDGGAFIYFGEKRVDLGVDDPGYKKFQAAFEKIARERLPYFGYMTTDRASIKRGQVSGCLDCHSLFIPQEIKAWTKVEKSIWSGVKSDLFYPKCPECGERWVFTDKVRGESVTLEGIQKMDVFLVKNKAGDREIPFGLL
ncbi:MAG: hypothetical protein ABJO36_12035 [Litorimonas sp.]